MQSLPHCRVSTLVVFLPRKRVARERVYVYVYVYVCLVYVRGIADAGSVGETKNAQPDCDEEV